MQASEPATAVATSPPIVAYRDLREVDWVEVGVLVALPADACVAVERIAGRQTRVVCMIFLS